MGTAGTQEKVDFIVEELGFDGGINYKTEDVAARVLKWAPEGVDMLWESRRETDFDWAIGLLAKRGRMVVMAGRDARPMLPV
ncbi:zinc-binding dehydrogenase, partial [uncultured Nocardioides sp.]|uniref:zinc-binding dehydrogenase n=1 Tax=uncultured Nocardioides sp. TaxID=198441 RepID=UPI0034574F2E